MKSTIRKYVVVNILILTGLSTYAFAESNVALPQSTQVKQDLNETNTSQSIEIVPEIVIKTGDTTTNPSLKEGVACDDETLEEAILGPDDHDDIPMAQTIPCTEVDCKGLKAAKLLKDTYKKVPMAKTQKLVPCVKK